MIVDILLLRKVWTCAENISAGGCWRRSEQAGVKEEELEIHGCVERGHADNWCDRGRCRGQGEMKEDDLPWRLREKKLDEAERGRKILF